MSKYKLWYDSIINNAVNQHRSKKDQYYERHHIIPKSAGGDNSRDNLVLLTAKEHFICHLLLPKFTSGKIKVKMIYALHMLVVCENEHQERHIINSSQYARIKKNMAIEVAKNHKGKITSEECKQKIREHHSIGTFVTPWGQFVSATQAASNCPTGVISPHTMLNYCKQPGKILHKRTVIQSRFFNDAMVGKPYSELGFNFIPRQSN